ncbi:MAG: phosphatase PAP2 family protein [Oscillospiraceae bacterium]|nr:phosphatase PAP2 family protein [Oscillospiraceae bacterium]
MKPFSKQWLAERLRDPETGRYRYLWLLLFYPLYLISFFILEGMTLPYHYLEWGIDRVIPFCEYFVLPYVLWHGTIGLLSLYLLFFDIPELKRLLRYFIFTYVITFTVYVVWPTALDLRPTEFPRDNVFTWVTRHVIYAADPSTNVCPSMHILGTFGLWFASGRTKRFSGPLARVLWGILCLSICLSTVLLKQHSVIDVLAALPLTALGWVFAYSGLVFRRKDPR